MILRALTYFALVVLCAATRAADFSGTYTNKEDDVTTTLTLTQTGDKVTGKAKSEDGELTLEATVTGSEMKGTATATGVPVKLYITGTLQGENLSIKIGADEAMTDADTIVFKRVSGGKPLGESTTTVTPAGKQETTLFSKAPTDVLKNGKEYTHPSGGKLKYPANWTLKEAEDHLQLIPDNAKDGEMIFIKAESADGATDPGSPEVLGYLDSQLAGSIPDAKREKSVEKCVSGSGKGVIVSWTGTLEGKATYIRAYVTIIKKYGVALIAVGTKSSIEARDKELRQVFQTFGWGQGKVDQRLVGAWNYWGYKGSSDGKYGREERARAVLNQDGTFSYTNSAETNISAQGKDAGGNETWAGGLSSRRGNGWGGTWTADGSTIYLNFEDGSSEEFTYRFEQQGQNTFLVINPDDKKNRMEWSRG